MFNISNLKPEEIIYVSGGKKPQKPQTGLVSSNHVREFFIPTVLIIAGVVGDVISPYSNKLTSDFVFCLGLCGGLTIFSYSTPGFAKLLTNINL